MAANIDDILKRLATLQDSTTDDKAKKALPEILKDLKEFAQNQETERNKLADTINQLQTATASLKQANAEQARQIDELKKQLEGSAKTSSATPLNLAASFKGVMDTIQNEARNTPGVATTIKSMDIEVKGLVQVKDKDTLFVLPSLNSPIDTNSLSTLRISFGAIPVATTDSVAPSPASPEAPRSDPPRPEEPEAAEWSVETENPVTPMKPLEPRTSKPRKTGPKR